MSFKASHLLVVLTLLLTIFSTKSKCIFYKAYVDVLYDVWLVCWLKISALGRGIYLTYLFELCTTNRTEEGDGDWRFLFDVDFNGIVEKDFSPYPCLTSWALRQTASRICWTHCPHANQDPRAVVVHCKWNIPLNIYLKATQTLYSCPHDGPGWRRRQARIRRILAGCRGPSRWPRVWWTSGSCTTSWGIGEVSGRNT